MKRNRRKYFIGRGYGALTRKPSLLFPYNIFVTHCLFFTLHILNAKNRLVLMSLGMFLHSFLQVRILYHTTIEQTQPDD